jgi:hypothetical protein
MSLSLHLLRATMASPAWSLHLCFVCERVRKALANVVAMQFPFTLLRQWLGIRSGSCLRVISGTGCASPFSFLFPPNPHHPTCGHFSCLSASYFLINSPCTSGQLDRHLRLQAYSCTYSKYSRLPFSNTTGGSLEDCRPKPSAIFTSPPSHLAFPARKFTRRLPSNRTRRNHLTSPSATRNSHHKPQHSLRPVSFHLTNNASSRDPPTCRAKSISLLTRSSALSVAVLVIAALRVAQSPVLPMLLWAA